MSENPQLKIDLGGSCRQASDIIKMSVEPLTCSHRRSNLLLKELIFRCPNINLLILLTWMFWRVFLASEKVAIEALNKFSILL